MDTEPYTLSEANLSALVEIRSYVKSKALALGGIDDAVSELALAVNEAVTNIIIHGYGYRPGYIQISLSRHDNDLIVYLRDKAPPFDPNSVPPPDITIPLERRRPGGMGVHMMRSFTDEMRYSSNTNGMNELVLLKRGAADRAISGTGQ